MSTVSVTSPAGESFPAAGVSRTTARPSASETSDGVYSLPQKIEGPDRIVQDVAARGVDLRNGHLAAAVVDLAAHGSVGENLRIAQHEVIAVAFHDIAAAGFVVARDDPELHAVAVHLTESRRKAFQYLRGTRLRRIALQYAAKTIRQ